MPVTAEHIIKNPLNVVIYNLSDPKIKPVTTVLLFSFSKGIFQPSSKEGKIFVDQITLPVFLSRFKKNPSFVTKKT